MKCYLVDRYRHAGFPFSNKTHNLPCQYSDIELTIKTALVHPGASEDQVNLDYYEATRDTRQAECLPDSDSDPLDIGAANELEEGGYFATRADWK